MSFTIDKVASCLDLPVNTVDRWIRQGKIPIKKDGQFCVFDETVVREWARQHNLSFSTQDKDHIKATEPDHDALISVMKRGGVFYNIKGDTPTDVIKAAVSNIPSSSEDQREQLYKRLLEREEMMSTGIGQGVAIPHPRAPIVGFPEKALISSFFLDKAIDFNSIDNKPVFIMFILLSPDVKDHLNLLSRISFCVRDRSFIEFLKQVPNPDIFYSKIVDFEKKLDLADTM